MKLTRNGKESEWDKFPNNKLRKIFPKLNDCIACLSLTNRREETVTSQLHIGHSYITYSFLLNF